MDAQLATCLVEMVYGQGATIEVEQDEASGWARAIVRLPNGSLVPDEPAHHRTPAVALAECLHRLAEAYRWAVRTSERQVQVP